MINNNGSLNTIEYDRDMWERMRDWVERGKKCERVYNYVVAWMWVQSTSFGGNKSIKVALKSARLEGEREINSTKKSEKKENKTIWIVQPTKPATKCNCSVNEWFSARIFMFQIQIDPMAYETWAIIFHPFGNQRHAARLDIEFAIHIQIFRSIFQ